jgi:predicted transcriptional regulator
MATVKMAISLQEPLFEKAQRLARKRKVPRSRVVSEALEQYFERRETQALMEKLNEVHAGGLDEEDKRFLDAAFRRMGQRAKEENW